MPTVLVPVPRWERWVTNFAAAHGAPELEVVDGALLARAPDGSTYAARLPFSQAYEGEPDAAALGRMVVVPPLWGILLVRKGGFAVARVADGQVSASKVGQRHVQGRTKAGGQSQQRFARRRANQARDAYGAAADHAVAVLGDVGLLVAGGDRSAVDEVLADPRLAGRAVVGPWFPVPDPRRAVLEGVLADARSLVVEVENAAGSARVRAAGS